MPTKTKTPLIALVGNPNAGKTTLFNALTGASQRVGNFPGVTVEKAIGSYRQSGREVEVLDVPGLYSLHPVSIDERVAANVVRGRSSSSPPVDLLVCVIDASNLERNLFLFGQILELGKPVIAVLSMTDLVKESDPDKLAALLSDELGVDVIPVTPRKKGGLERLRIAIDENLANPKQLTKAHKRFIGSEALARGFRESLARAGIDVSREELESALMEEEPTLRKDLGEIPELLREFDETRTAIASQGQETRGRYDWARAVTEAVLPQGSSHKARILTDRIDAVLTHRFFGLLVFVGVMFLVFQSIYTFAGPLMDGINWAVELLKGWVRPMLSSTPMLQSLVVDGVIAGVGGVIIFLPQILILFLFISILEGTGYLARAAFLMDKLLGWCGLNGRAFIPLLSSFACAIPGIMAARVMPDQRSRLATIIVAPLMSCSARLPVYVLLIGAFIEPQFGAVWAGIALFAMHFVGLIVAIPVVHLLNRGVIKGQRTPFLLEMPPYQMPKLRDVWFTVYTRGKVFVKTAGTIIVALSVVIWALLYFPRSDDSKALWSQQYSTLSAERKEQISENGFLAERQIENSYLGRFGHAIEPVFVPAGFDWRISTAILAAFPAREVLVSSMGILFSLGGDVDEASPDLRKSLQQATWPDGKPLLTPWTAVGLMVFFALCCQCMATLATIKRETNSWKWPVFTFTYMTTLAYLAAVGIHQLARVFEK